VVGLKENKQLELAGLGLESEKVEKKKNRHNPPKSSV